MVVFQIMYPYAENYKFDMDYYVNNHLVAAGKLLGDSCLKVEVTKGFKEFYPDTTPFFAAFTDEVDAFLMEDIPKFTDIAPVWQLEEVVYQGGK